MNKIVVITGASSGLGKATLESFKSKGDTVINISNILNEEPTEFDYECDITNEDRVKEVVNSIKEKYGRVDVLVNNAGMGVNGALELLSTDIVRKAIDVNVTGAFIVTKHILPLMQRGSKIVYIASVSALMPSPFRSVYHFTKSAVLMMALCQRLELNQAGIDVITLCPGEIQTAFMKNRVKVYETNERYGKRIDRSYEKMQQHDNGKRMKPEKVAGVIVKQCYKKHSRAMIVVGKQAKLMYLGTRLSPLCLTLKASNKIMGGGKLD